MQQATSEWLVRLHYSFQNEDSLYLVMDYLPGGKINTILGPPNSFSNQIWSIKNYQTYWFVIYIISLQSHNKCEYNCETGSLRNFLSTMGYLSEQHVHPLTNESPLQSNASRSTHQLNSFNDIGSGVFLRNDHGGSCVAWDGIRPSGT